MDLLWIGARKNKTLSLRKDEVRWANSAKGVRQMLKCEPFNQSEVQGRSLFRWAVFWFRSFVSLAPGPIDRQWISQRFVSGEGARKTVLKIERASIRVVLDRVTTKFC